MRDPIVESVAVLHRFISGSGELEATLKAITDLAVEAVGSDMAGLTMRDERLRPTTLVYTDRMVPEIDQVQYDFDRGPCLDASRTQTVFEIEDTATDQRWPEFAAAALAHGLHTSLSIPVVVANNGLGALNFYDHRPGFFDHDKREFAEAFAGQCAAAGMFWHTSSEAQNLAKAMESRATIEQAKGVIMATTGCSADDAFALLREQSQRENRKLREVADEIVSRQKR